MIDTTTTSGDTGSRRTRNLILATTAFALSFFAWSVLAPFAKGFQRDLNLSYTEMMLLTAIPVILGSVLRIPVGALTDRIGGRITFTALLTISALPALLIGFVDSYAGLLGVGLLLGIAGSSFAIGVPFISGWYPKSRQGLALGVFGLGNGGTSIAFFVAPTIADRWGRDALGITLAVMLVVTAALFWLLATDAPRTSSPPRFRETLAAGMRLHRLSFFYFITFGGFVAMALLLPTLLQDWFGFSPANAAARAGGFVVIATLMRPVGGWLADRMGGYLVLMLAFAAVITDAAVLASLSSIPQIAPITAACLTMGAALGMGNGAVFKIVAEEFPSNTGAATGLVGAAGGIGGFLPVLFVGIVKDIEGTYTYGFVALQACAVVCFVAVVWMLRSVPPSAGSVRGSVCEGWGQAPGPW